MITYLKLQSIILCITLLVPSIFYPVDHHNHVEENRVVISVVQEPKFNHEKPIYKLDTVQYFNPPYKVSTSYSKSKFYQQLLQVEMSDDVRTNIVNIAKSQLGYIEGNHPSMLSGELQQNGNYTEYGYWYGMQDEWCAIFVSWCTSLAGKTNVSKHALCSNGLKKFINNETAHSRQDIVDGKYIPQPGDIIYFCSSSAAAEGKLTTHVGIVSDYKDGYIYTIEGNTSPIDKSINCGGIVEEKKYSIKNTWIAYVCESI